MISLKKVGLNPTTFRVVCSNEKCKYIHYTLGYVSSICPKCGRIGAMPNSMYSSVYSRFIHYSIKINEK